MKQMLSQIRTSEIMEVGKTDVQMSIDTVESTTDFFDPLLSEATFGIVPGTKLQYARFGTDNLLPYDLISLIESDEVCAQNMFFNSITCYGAGVELQDIDTAKPTKDKEVRRWARSQSLSSYWMENCTDMKFFFFAVAVVILNNEGTKINKLRHKEAAHCRFQKANAEGRIENVFFANWKKAEPSVETIPLLDIHDPIGDLMARMGREPDARGRMLKPTRERKFAILLKYPTVGCRYYPVPHYSAVFRGGSYEEKRLISAAKRSKLRNFSSVRYQVEVHRDYWERVLDAEDITDPEEAKARINKEKENIRDFVTGIHNADKVWISGYYTDPDGHEQRDIRIQNIERAKEGGDWGEDINISANTMCYGFNVHPNLVGAVPGKSQTNNSGSDKRELFTMKQALEKSFHDILLMPLQLVCEFNGWENIEPSVPMIMLTTLDTHTDAKRINPNQSDL